MRHTYVCNMCGGNTVTRDAWGEWDVDEQNGFLAPPMTMLSATIAKKRLA